MDAPGDSATSAKRAADLAQPGLRRAISRPMLVAFVVGDILGAGIYARVGAVAEHAGGAIWLSFAVGIGIAALTALSYAELSSKYPSAGGAALFVHRAFEVPMLSFVVAFTLVASGVSSAGAVARVFGGRYLQELLVAPPLLASALFVLVIGWINLRGIAESVWVNVCLTAIELSGLLLIIAIGAAALAEGTGVPARAMALPSLDPASAALAVLAGAAIAFYACIGFEDVANLAEEAQDAPRSLPVALLGGLAIAGVVYVAVAVTAAMVVDPARLAASSGPLLEVVLAGPIAIPPTLFSAIALLAVSNTALINLIMASRVLYGMAEHGVVPAIFGRTHRRRRTPWVAIAFTTALTLLLVATGDVGDLANTTVLLLLGCFVLVHVSLLRLRRDRVEHTHFSVPAVVPVLGTVTCISLMTQLEAEVFLRASLLVGLGVALAALRAVTRRAAPRGTGKPAL
jgi:amino acid transporter